MHTYQGGTINGTNPQATTVQRILVFSFINSLWISSRWLFLFSGGQGMAMKQNKAAQDLKYSFSKYLLCMQFVANIKTPNCLVLLVEESNESVELI